MKKTILVVEDEDILREIIKDYLLNEGYHVLESSDGKEALTLFQDHDVHLIILDIMLPELDGWSVCRRIRKSSNVTIIMLTARVDEDDTLLGFELGADDYVTKPYSPTETTESSRLEWIQAIDCLKELNPKFVIAGHKVPENDNNPKILDETKQYLLDFIRLDKETDTVLDLYNAMLNLYPNRANPRSLWGAANAAKA